MNFKVKSANWTGVLRFWWIPVLAILLVNIRRIFSSFGLFAMSKERVEIEQETIKAVETTPITKSRLSVSETQLQTIVNRIYGELTDVFYVSGKYIESLLEPLNEFDKDWVFVHFGIKNFKYPLAIWSKGDNLSLFGWFDMTLNSREQKRMAELWKGCSNEYKPKDKTFAW